MVYPPYPKTYLALIGQIWTIVLWLVETKCSLTYHNPQHLLITELWTDTLFILIISLISEGISEQCRHIHWALRVPPVQTTVKTICAVSGCKITLNDDSLHWRTLFLHRFYCFIDFQFSFPANPCPYINSYVNCDALKAKATCENAAVKLGCPASCLCDNKIIPIAKKWNLLWPHIYLIISLLWCELYSHSVSVPSMWNTSNTVWFTNAIGYCTFIMSWKRPVCIVLHYYLNLFAFSKASTITYEWAVCVF